MDECMKTRVFHARVVVLGRFSPFIWNANQHSDGQIFLYKCDDASNKLLLSLWLLLPIIVVTVINLSHYIVSVLLLNCWRCCQYYHYFCCFHHVRNLPLKAKSPWLTLKTIIQWVKIIHHYFILQNWSRIWYNRWFLSRATRPISHRVGPSVRPSHFAFFAILGITAPAQGITAPAQLPATEVVVYTA